jgi:eukaryotic-like serine/threonine-protein kinase
VSTHDNSLRERYHPGVNDETRVDAASTAMTSRSVEVPETESAALDGAPRIPGYELLRVIGRGGMGVVWEAFELRLGRSVALKVHPRALDENEALFREALVAARIGDPSIVRVLDVGMSIDGQPYYAMELVEGTDLAAILADGPITPRRAIAIASDIARAASAAHQHGVVHRDLKPRNVIVDPTGRARVLDFGIALDVHEGGDPLGGPRAGSPPYMAPEQVEGEKLGPATDLWAIGVMLYEMLTGERPFIGATVTELMARIVAHDPPPPSAIAPSIHADVDAIVLRCLAKPASERFPSAAALFESLTALVEGKPVQRTSGQPRRYVPKASGTLPAVKPARSDAKKHFAWAWRLASSPAALWPHVADTDRFNKAVGLAPVTFTDEPRPDGLVKRTGHIRVLGMSVSWRELPFEWVKNRIHSVFRWYDAGPIAALWNEVSLQPLEEGGTELRHQVWLTPRGVIGQLAAFLEIERKLAPAVDRFYRRLDEIVASGAATDPFEPPHVATSEARQLVESACRSLHAEGFDASLVEKLAMFVLTAPDAAVAPMRPYELAQIWGTERAETVDVCIHAARLGLLEPSWDIICPRCMIAHESRGDLAAVKRHGNCMACATAFERDLRDSVELVFSPHPSVRIAPRTTYCVGSPAKRPHVIAQQALEPGEVREVDLDLERGAYRIVGHLASQPWDLVASAIGFETEIEARSVEDRIEARPAVVKAGPVRVRLENPRGIEETFRIEVAGAREDVVSGADALTHPSFRAYFSEQLLAQGEHLSVRQLAFLFVELASRETLFDERGDGEACAELTRLDAMVAEAAARFEGNVVPSSMSMLVVAFPTNLRALHAALHLRKMASEQPFVGGVAMVLHDGRCIALTRGGKPEFFGETLHRGQSLLQVCPADAIALSASVTSDRAVAIAVHEAKLTTAIDKVQDGPYAGRRIMLLLP